MESDFEEENESNERGSSSKLKRIQPLETGLLDFGSGGSGGGGGAGRDWPDADGKCWKEVVDNSGALPVTKLVEIACLYPEEPKDQEPVCNACARITIVERNLNFLLERVVTLENGGGGNGGGGSATNDEWEIYGLLVGELANNYRKINNDMMNYLPEIKGRLSGFQDQFDRIQENMGEGFLSLDVSMVSLMAKSNDILQSVKAIKFELPQSFYKNIEDILLRIPSVEEIERTMKTMNDNLLGVSAKIFTAEKLAEKLKPLNDNLVLLLEKNIGVDDLEELIKPITEILSDILTAVGKLDKPEFEIPNSITKLLENIEKAINNIDLVGGDAGTSFWDFIGGLFGDIFELIEFLIEKLIYLVVPEDSTFITTSLSGLSDSISSKFEPMNTLKDSITSSLQFKEKEFEKLTVDLPVFGNVQFFDPTYINMAIPKLRQLISGMMVLFTAFWAYRRITTEMIK